MRTPFVAILLVHGCAALAQGSGSGQSGLGAIQTIEREFKANSPSFDRLSPGTWGQLDGGTREEIRMQYRQVYVTKDTLTDKDAAAKLSDIAAKADLHALISLKDKGVLDPLILRQMGIESTTPKTSSLTDNEKTAVAWYRKLAPRLGIVPGPIFGSGGVVSPSIGSTSGGCGGACAVVGPGDPSPQVPGVALPSPSQGAAPLAPGRLPRSFNPTGFQEVVLIEFDDSDSCTGTLLSPKVVLTAAHCVYGRPKGGIKIRLPVYSANQLARCKKILAESMRYEKCLEFQTGTVSMIRIHNRYDPSAHTNDVAYLVLDAPHANGSYAKVRFINSVPERITIAGYGDNGLDAKRNLAMRYALEVGWHNGKSVEAKKGKIGWLYSMKTGESATCAGDSGGPIYAADYDGGVDANPHELFAITSVGTNATCRDFFVRQTKLSEVIVKQWMCSETELKSIVDECQPT